MGEFLNPLSENPIGIPQIPHLFFTIPHSIFSENPQLFGFGWCQFVEGLSISLWDVHIEVVIGDDRN